MDIDELERAYGKQLQMLTLKTQAIYSEYTNETNILSDRFKVEFRDLHDKYLTPIQTFTTLIQINIAYDVFCQLSETMKTEYTNAFEKSLSPLDAIKEEFCRSMNLVDEQKFFDLLDLPKVKKRSIEKVKGYITDIEGLRHQVDHDVEKRKEYIAFLTNVDRSVGEFKVAMESEVRLSSQN